MRGSTGHAVDLMRVAYSDDCTRIVTGAADCAVSLWDAETLKHLGTVVAPSVGDVVASVRFVRDSHDVVIARAPPSRLPVARGGSPHAPDALSHRPPLLHP